jgi:6-phosphogluconolactonase
MARLTSSLVVTPDAEALAEEACRRVADRIGAASERCRIALAGGSTPKRLYRLLASDESIDWKRVELFWGDERMVPPDHEDSNYRMARQTLIDHVPIPETQVHRIETERGAERARVAYAEQLEPLDLVLLGMGTDGHTASLFPGGADGDGVVITESPAPPHERISLGLDVINAAGEVLMLVSGKAKASRFAEVYGDWQGKRASLPAARVRPKRLVWLLDEAAASELPEDVVSGARAERKVEDNEQRS